MSDLDDDVEWLRDLMGSPYVTALPGSVIGNVKTLAAIIARLEAAEKMREALGDALVAFKGAMNHLEAAGVADDWLRRCEGLGIIAPNIEGQGRAAIAAYDAAKGK